MHPVRVGFALRHVDQLELVVRPRPQMAQGGHERADEVVMAVVVVVEAVDLQLPVPVVVAQLASTKKYILLYKCMHLYKLLFASACNYKSSNLQVHVFVI